MEHTLTIPFVAATAAGRFRRDGRYAVPPGEWRDADDALARRRFFAVFERCVAALPPAAARAFTMREIRGCSVAETCAALGITAGECAALLHDARQRLRESLEERWFAPARRLA